MRGDGNDFAAGIHGILKNKRKEQDTMRKNFKDFMREEDGMGTVEVILIIVVLIGLVIIFKNQLTQIVNNIFSKISSQANSI